MSPRKPSHSLAVSPRLKARFKKRCKYHSRPMAEVLEELVTGWDDGHYSLSGHTKATPPETIYVPEETYLTLKRLCRDKLSLRAALEALIAGWLSGKFTPPPPKERAK